MGPTTSRSFAARIEGGSRSAIKGGTHPKALSGGEHSRWALGRKPVPTRLVLEAVRWMLNTSAQWHMLPQCYPNYKTVHRRFQTWRRNEILRQVLTDIANELRERGALDEEECFIDASLAMAKGGGAEIGATKRGKTLKINNPLKRILREIRRCTRAVGAFPDGQSALNTAVARLRELQPLRLKLSLPQSRSVSVPFAAVRLTPSATNPPCPAAARLILVPFRPVLAA